MQQFARAAYSVLSWLFVAGVVVQFFFAGMVVVAFRMTWENHVGLGHALGIPLVLMLIAMYVGRLSKEMKRSTWILFAAYVVLADVLIFLRSELPFASALHPVFALIVFTVGWSLARKATPYLRGMSSLESPKATTD